MQTQTATRSYSPAYYDTPPAGLAIRPAGQAAGTTGTASSNPTVMQFVVAGGVGIGLGWGVAYLLRGSKRSKKKSKKS